MAADTGQLILQDNGGYGFWNLAAVPENYLPNHWYRLAVVWGVGGAITGQLYDSDGTTLLNSVQAADNSITAGGIAFLATAYDKYFDTVTATRTTTQATARLNEQRPVPTMPYLGALLTQLGQECSVAPWKSGPRWVDAASVTAPQVTLLPLPQIEVSQNKDWTPSMPALQERLVSEYFASVDVAGLS